VGHFDEAAAQLAQLAAGPSAAAGSTAVAGPSAAAGSTAVAGPSAAAGSTAVAAALPSGTTRHAIWQQLCELVSQHPGAIHSVRVEPLLRTGIARFTDEVGRFWCALAEYYVRLGQFERARDIYEEAMQAVSTVRDFATLFDAYAQFEEAMLTARLQMEQQMQGEQQQDAQAAARRTGDGDVRDPSELDDTRQLGERADDAELRIARLEVLMERRPLLLSSVLLRQNPHNVHEWLKRAKTLAEAEAPAERICQCFNEAVATVDPWQAVGGKPAALWIDYARYHAARGDFASAESVLRRAVEAAHKSSDDLASCWCEWAEMLVGRKDYTGALRIMEAATAQSYAVPAAASAGARGEAATASAGRKRARSDDAAATDDGAHAAEDRADKEGSSNGRVFSDYSIIGVASKSTFKPSPGVRAGVSRNLRAWGLYLDLEESLGTVATVKAAYDRCLALKVCTPAMLLSYAAYLEERKYFEESFRAFEKGVALFPWPNVKDIWIQYLTKFQERYGGTKLERTRDLFEQALAHCPADECAPIFRMYAEMEEQYGLVRHMMAVYDRACKAVTEKGPARYEMYLLWIRKTQEFLGAVRTREIYERAVEALPDAQVKDMCLRFAAMEASLGEIDRARAVYAYASQFCDPQVAVSFWNTWKEFEVGHGNEDTFREMLRIKRSVANQFATANSLVAETLRKKAEQDARSTVPLLQGMPTGVGDYVTTAVPPAGVDALVAAPSVRRAAVGQDPAALDIDADTMGDASDAQDVAVKSVPAGVFGGLQQQSAPTGAIERFKVRY
jgi:pre-mRNA-splicing factor SYF1